MIYLMIVFGFCLAVLAIFVAILGWRQSRLVAFSKNVCTCSEVSSNENSFRKDEILHTSQRVTENAQGILDTVSALIQDHLRIDANAQGILDNASDMAQFEKEFNCFIDGGHKYVFVEKGEHDCPFKPMPTPDVVFSIEAMQIEAIPKVRYYNTIPKNFYLFRCKCGHEITKTWKALTKTEKDALKVMGMGE